MSTESSRYAYRLGFRFATKECSGIDGGQKQRRDAAGPLHRIRVLQQMRSSSTHCVHRSFRTEASRHVLTVSSTQRNNLGPISASNGRDLAAIQIQRLVRGWRARVWAVKVVHDRAWKALLLIQAIWRGALMRHKLRREGATEPLGTNDECKADFVFQEKSKRRFKHKNYHAPSSGGLPLQQRERCTERVAWEQSWERVRLERPDFRDRVRVWQSISELKRAGGRGRMGITNDEAWVALRDSSGSVPAAAILLSNEEYLLGRRLQQRHELRELNKVPPHLSLAVRDINQGSSHSPLARRSSSRSIARSCAVGMGDCDRKRTTEAGRGAGSRNDIFGCVSDLFYNAPTATRR